MKNYLFKNFFVQCVCLDSSGRGFGSLLFKYLKIQKCYFMCDNSGKSITNCDSAVSSFFGRPVASSGILLLPKYMWYFLGLICLCNQNLYNKNCTSVENFRQENIMKNNVNRKKINRVLPLSILQYMDLSFICIFDTKLASIIFCFWINLIF